MSRRWKAMRALRPANGTQLDQFLKTILGIRLPRRAVCKQHSAPFDYLEHVFFERPGEPIIWANRGGGKTFLGAVATLLDMLFKPGIQIRILGGSMEQSSRMYAYLLKLMDRQELRGLTRAKPTQRRITLVNGSVVELLSQSQTSVRGTRVQKLRCDEVELFDPDVWQAAQLVTRSAWCGDIWVRGAVEAFSTMHRPFGLMNTLVREASEAHESADHDATQPDNPGRVLFKWCAMDVIERCAPQRDCDTCALWDSCGGRAKDTDGFMLIDDLITMQQRASDEAWASEMLCRRPRRTDCVYPMFDPPRHVRRRAAQPFTEDVFVIGGMDFGLRSPLVMLWATVREPNGDTDSTLEIIDEYVQTDRTLEQHLAVITERPWPWPRWLGVDPAGAQRNAQTGLTDIAVLRAHGLIVRHRVTSIREGIERVRRRLDRDLLSIDPRCETLIEALATYHFDAARPQNEAPVKDGPDHLCDALRYMIVNLEMGAKPITAKRYV